MLQYGQTALFKAAEKGHADTVKMLVNYGATVDIRDKVTNCFITCMKIQYRCLLYDYYCMSCLLYTSPSPRDATLSRMPSSA